MRISENEIEALVRGVLNNLQNENGNTVFDGKLNPAPGAYGGPSKFGGGRIDDPQNRPSHEHAHGASELHGLHGIFDSPDEAVRAAQTAQQQWVSLPLTKRQECVQAMRDAGVLQARHLAEMTVEETGLGRVDDKEVKNQLASEKSPGWEMLPLTTFYGEDGLTIEDYFPFGVLCGITPVTNPTSGLINNAIIFAVGGNSGVFCPHPSAKKSTMVTMAVMNDAVANAGGPRNLFTGVANPTLETAQAIMQNPIVRLINATGGPAVVKAALAVGKKAVCAGPGNPPAIVDETADLDNAATAIVGGASFDNNLLCIGEKIVVAVDSIADKLIEKMRMAGAYLVSGDDAKRLVEYVIPDGHVAKEPIGLDASVILAKIGISAPRDTKIVLLELPADHPLVIEEQLMPVIPLVRARDFRQAVEFAFKAEGGRGHTLVVHSQNINRISALRNSYPCNVFVANGSSAAAEGIGGEGYLAMSLAGHTGEGFTNPATFVKKRRVALAGAMGTGGRI
jgi:propionaldehyde dehydrogenase